MRTVFVVLVLFGSLAGYACADEPVTLLPPTSATLPEAAPKASQGVYYQHNGQWWYLKPGNRWYVWDGTAWQKSATGLNLTPQVKPGLGSTTPWNSTPVRPPSTMTVYDDTAPDPRMTVDSELLLYRQQPDYWGRGYPAPQPFPRNPGNFNGYNRGYSGYSTARGFSGGYFYGPQNDPYLFTPGYRGY
jgi:hypothetical protein